jgi:hypothetical protein
MTIAPAVKENRDLKYTDQGKLQKKISSFMQHISIITNEHGWCNPPPPEQLDCQEIHDSLLRLLTIDELMLDVRPEGNDSERMDSSWVRKKEQIRTQKQTVQELSSSGDFQDFCEKLIRAFNNADEFF